MKPSLDPEYLNKMKVIKRFEFILIFLWLEFTFWYFRLKLMAAADSIFLRIIGKTLSDRSAIIQFAAISCMALAAALVIRWILHIPRNEFIGIVSLAVIFLLIGIICGLQTLRRDDYWEIHDANKYGFPGFIYYEYININGRYFSLFLKNLYRFLPSVLYINCMLFATFAFLCAGSSFLVKQISQQTGRINYLAGGVCIALEMILMSANIWEVWFWGGRDIYLRDRNCARGCRCRFDDQHREHTRESPKKNDHRRDLYFLRLRHLRTGHGFDVFFFFPDFYSPGTFTASEI